MELAASAIDRMTEPDENELSRDANTPRLRPIGIGVVLHDLP